MIDYNHGSYSDLSTVDADRQQLKSELRSTRGNAEQQHDTAPDDGERKSSWFVVRVIRRLLGRK